MCSGNLGSEGIGVSPSKQLMVRCSVSHWMGSSEQLKNRSNALASTQVEGGLPSIARISTRMVAGALDKSQPKDVCMFQGSSNLKSSCFPLKFPYGEIRVFSFPFSFLNKVKDLIKNGETFAFMI